MNVGDTVRFEWLGEHNVYIHPSGTCDESRSVFVGSSSGSTYTFKSNDVGDVFFACQVGSHCDAGQIVRFIVSNSSPTPAPTPSSVACVDSPLRFKLNNKNRYCEWVRKKNTK